MDAAEIIAVFVALVVRWRITLCVVLSIAAAIWIVTTVPWLTGLQGLVLASLGFFPGAVWEDRAWLSPQAAIPNSPQTSLPVAVAASTITGATWGLFSATSAHSLVAGAGIFLFFAVGWSWYVVLRRPLVSKQRATICVLSAAIAYPMAFLVQYAL